MKDVQGAEAHTEADEQHCAQYVAPDSQGAEAHTEADAQQGVQYAAPQEQPQQQYETQQPPQDGAVSVEQAEELAQQVMELGRTDMCSALAVCDLFPPELRSRLNGILSGISGSSHQL